MGSYGMVWDIRPGMKILATLLGLLVASAAGAFEHPGGLYSQAMIEHAQTLLATDPSQAHTAWTDEALVAIATCVGHVPQCDEAMTPDYSHHDYVQTCEDCVGGTGTCCQLDMGSSGPCALKVSPATGTCSATCSVGGTPNPECDMLDANSTTRGYLDDDAECAMWNALAYAIDHDTPNSAASYAQDAADIINDWTSQMTSVEIQFDEHTGTGMGNESALNAVSRLSGLYIAADLIWDAGVLSAAEKTQFQTWMTGPIQFAAVERVNADKPYSNQSAGGMFAGLMVGFMNDDAAVFNIWWDGGDTGLGNVNQTLTDVVPGIKSFIDEAICPSDEPSSECDLNRITAHASGVGEPWQDADREEASFGDGSEAGFYVHKFLQNISGAVELGLNVKHEDIWNWVAVDGSSLRAAATFLYKGTNMVCPDDNASGGPPQDTGDADGLCDHDGTTVTNFCEDDYDTNNPQDAGSPDGLCDWDATTVSYCSETATNDDTPGFWGAQHATKLCTYWRKLEGRCTDKFSTGGPPETGGVPNGLCDSDGATVSEKRSGWPFLGRYVLRMAYHEPTWAADADVDFPIDAVSRVDDGNWRTPEVLFPTFGRSSLDGASPCFWGGPSGAAGNNFTPCAESVN